MEVGRDGLALGPTMICKEADFCRACISSVGMSLLPIFNKVHVDSFMSDAYIMEMKAKVLPDHILYMNFSYNFKPLF